MRITATQLRKDVYRILDRVIETGIAVEVERAGTLLRIVPVERPSKLRAAVKRDVLVGDPEDFVHLDWSDEWQP